MSKATDKPQRVDTNELDFPETVFVRDVENRVFQAYVLQCLSKIQGISLLEGNFIDNILGRDSVEGVKGIHAEQDSSTQTVSVRVEVNVCYGVSIPQKAEEIQQKIAEEISGMTGLHVSCVHVVFRNVIMEDPKKKHIDLSGLKGKAPSVEEENKEYSDDF